MSPLQLSPRTRTPIFRQGSIECYVGWSGHWFGTLFFFVSFRRSIIFKIPLVSCSLLTSSSLVGYPFVTFDIILAIFFFIFTFLLYFSFYHFCLCLLLHFKFCFILNSTWVDIITILLSYLSSIRLHSISLQSNDDSCVSMVITVSSSSSSRICFFFRCCCCCRWYFSCTCRCLSSLFSFS